MIKISILTDNYPGRNCCAEHGLSYFIEHKGTRLLFDTGQSDLFLKNAAIMGIDISDIDMIVLSHGHFDHGDGLAYLPGGKLLCHPGCFIKRYRNGDHSYLGLQCSYEEIAEKFNLVTTDKPYKISDTIVFLGEIPRITDFESQQTPFSLEEGTPDFVPDDSAIAILTEQGLFVITGCGHAGIVNTLEQAKKVTNEDRIYGVMGGFHLKKSDRQTKETIQYLLNHKITHVIPSHCTAFPALVQFSKKFDIRLPKTGDLFSF
ncbi:MAG: MBL fold metallo-hydrolase [Bacteroidales bacterium]|nr:MBL fold metallo-hydrolase [Bacteroidales bacterium]